MCDGCLYLFSLTNRTGDSELETLPIVFFYLPWMNKARTSMINMRVVIPAASRNDFDLVYCRYRYFHSSPFEMVSKMCLLPSVKTAANILGSLGQGFQSCSNISLCPMDASSPYNCNRRIRCPYRRRIHNRLLPDIRPCTGTSYP